MRRRFEPERTGLRPAAPCSCYRRMHHEYHRNQPRSSQPTGIQLLGRRLRGRRAHVHGDFGHDDYERGPAIHRRRFVRRRDRRRLGHHQLSGRKRHRPADHRLAVGAPWSPQILPAIDHPLHGRLGPLRPGRQPPANDPLPGDPRSGGRRAAAVQPGRFARCVPARETGNRYDAFRSRRHYRAIVGPTLGGWISVNYDWPWIFLINVPIGLLSLLAA